LRDGISIFFEGAILCRLQDSLHGVRLNALEHDRDRDRQTDRRAVLKKKRRKGKAWEK
jgi:hypothetical protein